MNIFTIIFLQNFSKIFSKTHQIAPFLKFSWGSIPPNPPSKRVALPRAAWRFAPCKYPHFYKKKFEPPRNEILDTPLNIPHQHHYFMVYVFSATSVTIDGCSTNTDCPIPEETGNFCCTDNHCCEYGEYSNDYNFS